VRKQGEKEEERREKAGERITTESPTDKECWIDQRRTDLFDTYKEVVERKDQDLKQWRRLRERGRYKIETRKKLKNYGQTKIQDSSSHKNTTPSIFLF